LISVLKRPYMAVPKLESRLIHPGFCARPLSQYLFTSK